MTRAPTAEEVQVLRALSGHHVDVEAVRAQLERRGTPLPADRLHGCLVTLTRMMYVSRTGISGDLHYAITSAGEDALGLLGEVAA